MTRLLRGGGRYLADYAPAGTLHAVVVSSPHAHAGFRIGDVPKARAMPGGAPVLTGQPPGWHRTARDASPA